ncbi:MULTISPECIES: ABC transporter permease [Oerskovia]|uniref:ABC transporter permease n=1 Tax=Oerskovia rustica TaxID=2762237 RepID=A0ABR8RMQ0_9CELL|nr:ABC transporter permease [Oerskovia rustica]MBD7949060.1 ABC transporter permease [Oerskovia rustica]
MGRYIARRLGQGGFVLWAAFTISFFLLYVLPSDAASIKAAGADGDLSDPELVARLRAEQGLDRPVLVQYAHGLWGALHLDFGRSFSSGAPATKLLAEALPPTLQLTALALGLALAGGAALALASTYPRARWLRHTLTSLPALGISLPTFWVGLLLLQWFSFELRLFPAMGNEGFESLVLPAFTLAIPASAAFAQVLSRSLRQTLAEPYVETARAKGAGRARVHFGHALRNASIPALTVLGVTVGGLLAGAVVTETVFSRAGVGRLTVTAVNQQDVPVVQAIVVFSAVVFVVVTLLVDLLYPVLDPRITTRQPSAAA